MKVRFRFSVRMLLMLVTLVSAWFGGLELTRRYGVSHVRSAIKGRAGIDWHNSHITGRRTRATIAPFVVESDSTPTTWNKPSKHGTWHYRREYYVWFLGLVAKLPVERRLAFEGAGKDETGR